MEDSEARSLRAELRSLKREHEVELLVKEVEVQAAKRMKMFYQDALESAGIGNFTRLVPM